MHTDYSQILWILTGVFAGGVVGAGFGLIQNAAVRRNEQIQPGAQRDPGMAVMRGSMRRVAYLMIALVMVQVVCPLLFTSGVQWCVSAGVVIGYGWMLFSQLRQNLARNR